MADVSRFDKNITTAALRLHDNRAQAVADPDELSFRYSLTLLSKYQNQAIRDTIKDAYLKYGDDFDLVMPEVVNESGNLAMVSGVFTVPADCWIVLECAKFDYSWYAWKIKNNVLKVRASRDALITPTAAKPAWYQVGRTVQVLPTTIPDGNTHVFYVQQPSDQTAGAGASIVLSPMWDGEIIERMVAMGIADAKSAIAL